MFVFFFFGGGVEVFLLFDIIPMVLWARFNVGICDVCFKAKFVLVGVIYVRKLITSPKFNIAPEKVPSQ